MAEQQIALIVGAGSGLSASLAAEFDLSGELTKSWAPT